MKLRNARRVSVSGYLPGYSNIYFFKHKYIYTFFFFINFLLKSGDCSLATAIVPKQSSKQAQITFKLEGESTSKQSHLHVFLTVYSPGNNHIQHHRLG